jgi:hypothetical protein
MAKELTRGGFVARGAAAVGVVAVPALSRVKRASAAPKTIAVYRLDPHSEKCGGNKGACNACVQHDTNSLFPTAKAADGNRAHPGCDCCVVAGTLEFGTYVALFGNPKELHSYRADLRSPRVRAVLKGHAPVLAS